VAIAKGIGCDFLESTTFAQVNFRLLWLIGSGGALDVGGMVSLGGRLGAGGTNGTGGSGVPTPVITEFAIRTASCYPEGIAAGPDGNLWFTESQGNKIGRISP
jgi:streptogramin lyase